MPTIISGSDMRATPPSLRMSAGTRSSATTDTAPAASAILASSGVTTSMITPPLSISASPVLTRRVAVSFTETTLAARTPPADVNQWRIVPPSGGAWSVLPDDVEHDRGDDREAREDRGRGGLTGASVGGRAGAPLRGEHERGHTERKWQTGPVHRARDQRERRDHQAAPGRLVVVVGLG